MDEAAEGSGKGSQDGRDLGLGPEERRALTPAARRALAEAEARRQEAASADRPAEKGGRDGPEPVRYGDWEKNGLISDF